MVDTVQLLLIRHAQPEYARVNLGRADPSLTEQGLVQAGRLREALAPYRISRLFSSPQLRALQTAQPLADQQELPVEQIKGLADTTTTSITTFRSKPHKNSDPMPTSASSQATCPISSMRNFSAPAC